jgi:hypothetical protein
MATVDQLKAMGYEEECWGPGVQGLCKSDPNSTKMITLASEFETDDCMPNDTSHLQVCLYVDEGVPLGGLSIDKELRPMAAPILAVLEAEFFDEDETQIVWGDADTMARMRQTVSQIFKESMYKYQNIKCPHCGVILSNVRCWKCGERYVASPDTE